MDRIEYVVFGTHEYQWALRPFGHLFAKYWGSQAVTYVGDRLEGPLPDNVEFMRVPCYAEGVWPWNHWFGNGVKATLEALRGDIVAVFLPDHWLARPVDLETVSALAGYMRAEHNVVRGNLSDGTALDAHGKVVAMHDGVSIVACADRRHCGCESGTALSPALWNRELFARILEPHWSLWGTEKLGTEKMHRDHPSWLSVGTRPAALKRVNGLRAHGGRVRAAWLEGLSDEDREAVRRTVPHGIDIVE